MIRDNFINNYIDWYKNITLTKMDNDFYFEVSTAGLNENDLKIELKGCVLSVSGQTPCKYKEGNYQVNVQYSLDWEIVKNIEKIEYKSLNGITHIFLRTKKEKENKIFINKME